MGLWLRGARRVAGFSQPALAAELGIHRNTLGNWERRPELSPLLITRIRDYCAAVGLSPISLLYRAGYLKETDNALPTSTAEPFGPWLAGIRAERRTLSIRRLADLLEVDKGRVLAWQNAEHWTLPDAERFGCLCLALNVEPASVLATAGYLVEGDFRNVDFDHIRHAADADVDAWGYRVEDLFGGLFTTQRRTESALFKGVLNGLGLPGPLQNGWEMERIR